MTPLNKKEEHWETEQWKYDPVVTANAQMKKNPKALAVFQEWIAANCTGGELMIVHASSDVFVVRKSTVKETILSLEDELSTGKSFH